MLPICQIGTVIQKPELISVVVDSVVASGHGITVVVVVVMMIGGSTSSVSDDPYLFLW